MTQLDLFSQSPLPSENKPEQTPMPREAGKEQPQSTQASSFQEPEAIENPAGALHSEGNSAPEKAENTQPEQISSPESMESVPQTTPNASQSENTNSEQTPSPATKSPGKKRGRKSLKELADDPDILHHVDELELTKQYYSISEVADMFRVNSSLIRYWENEFAILQPKKNKKGDRLFRPEDIRNIRLIYHLLRERKYTIEGARQKLKEDKKVAQRNFELVQSLRKVKKFLTELREQL